MQRTWLRKVCLRSKEGVALYQVLARLKDLTFVKRLIFYAEVLDDVTSSFVALPAAAPKLGTFTDTVPSTGVKRSPAAGRNRKGLEL